MSSTDNQTFHVVVYIIMVLFLVISTTIGLYFGFYKKQRTTEEYLLGGRKMNLLPVALSLVVTFQSAISVLGVPMEHYIYDTMTNYMFVAIMIANAIQALVLVPLLYPLRLTSTYELLYMAIVLLAPALALEAVAGIPLWLSVIVVGIIGTFYTSIGINKVGGMKRINSMSANTLQDILIDVLKDKQYKKTMFAKLAVLVYGAHAVGLAYLAPSLTGPITQGAFAGGIISIVVNMWVALGSVLYGAKAPTSLPVSIESCLTQNLTSLSAFNLTNTLATVTNFTTQVSQPFRLNMFKKERI
ncbi:sodium-coupled monocarboxylate transporter 1-like [Mya arenaria]|uniref:sodium-coupled monocarboxylate transporter 1-like n=1 Tax=Mya arenaria TaxID=6604 RepID=UPI0022E07E77|nr:sodium-coupled monocarboxylate transporter 1-like [Mya arenaria]